MPLAKTLICGTQVNEVGFNPAIAPRPFHRRRRRLTKEQLAQPMPAVRSGLYPSVSSLASSPSTSTECVP